MPQLKPLLAGLLISLLASGAGRVPEAAGETGIADPADINGIWRSQGYGWIWSIEGDNIIRYDAGDGYCIAHPDDEEDDKTGPINSPSLSADKDTLRLKRSDPDYIYTFERLTELPEECSETPDTDPVTVFDTTVKMFDEHFMFFKERKTDWPKLVESLREDVDEDTSESELFVILEDLVTPIGDSHIGVQGTVDDEADTIEVFNPAPREQPGGKPVASGVWNINAVDAIMGTSLQTSGELSWGMLRDDIGYLRIRTMTYMEPDDLEQALDDAMTAFADTKAVIVDVSMNRGGDDIFGRRIAARFAEQPTMAYSKRAGDYKDSAPQEVFLQPSERPSFHGPVYLITGLDTLSAAEVFTIAMRSLPNVTHIGETTDGSLSDELWKRLPNGWTMSLSNEIYADSKGEVWEGRGIKPEIALKIGDREVTAEDRWTVRRVVDFVRTHLQ